MPDRRTWTTLFAVLAILGLGLGFWKFVIQNQPPLALVPPLDLGPLPVESQEVATRPVLVSVEAFGTLLPARQAVLSVEQAGRIAAVFPEWRVGRSVEAGVELVRFDTRLYELAVEEAEAVLAEARASRRAAELETQVATLLREQVQERWTLALRESGRLESLLEGDGLVSESEVDRARSATAATFQELEAARGRVRSAEVAEDRAKATEERSGLSLALAREQLERRSVRAPFDGYLAGRAPAAGTYVLPGTPLVELVDLEQMHLSLQVHEDHLAGVRIGQPVHVRLPSRPDFVTRGSVAGLGVFSDPTTRHLAVEVDVENPARDDGQRELVAGLFAEATIELETRSSALTIERRHLRWLDEEPVAFVAERSAEGEGWVARPRPLDLGRSTGEGFLLDTGLTPGEVLITAPLDRLLRDHQAASAAGREGGVPVSLEESQ